MRDYNPYDHGMQYGPRPRDGGAPEAKVTKAEKTMMVIHSRHLINALKAVVGYYPDTSFAGEEVKIEAPYYVLVHHRAALLQYKVSQPETHDEEYASTAAKHIGTLLGFLETTYGQQIREEDGRHKRSTPTVTFDYLWLLLRPGEVIYTQYDNTWTPFVISRVWKKTTGSSDELYAYSSE
jgi:hypothetical protein